jgi:hypothetical protein
MTPTFHIATLVTDPAAYGAMRASMGAVGYDEPGRCRFTPFDNSSGNRFEPFGILRALRDDGDEPFVVLCHQDLLFGPATSVTVLGDRLRALTERHPRWAVAGTAGVNRRGSLLMHLDEPSGSHRVPRLPRRVDALDENLLVLRRSHCPVPSPGLSGFHFYGVDLCLNALRNGWTCHLIDFPVRHLSSGNPNQPAFHAARDAMTAVWRPRLSIGIVSSPAGHLRISRWPAVERLLQNRWVVGLLRRLRLAIVFARREGHP